MAKDPAFLFYPGDYLRDTQCLSESVQVAYDRIMCEHMRNICITQQQLNFFTKRLTSDQKEELLMVLTKKGGGYCIEWVVDSIEKRRSYSESRRKNRVGSKKKDTSKLKKDMLTYDSHMENEIEDEIVIKDYIEKNCNGFSDELKQWISIIEKKYDNQTSIIQIESWLRLLNGWYKLNVQKVECLNKHIAGYWKTINWVDVSKNDKPQSQAPYHEKEL